MSKTAHTPGPWSVQSEWDVWYGEADNPNAPLVSPDFNYRRWGREISRDEHAANATRIVACVNACEGIADPSVVPEAIEALREFRDHVIRHACTWDDAENGSHHHPIWVKIAEILSKLEGGKA